MNIGYSCKLLDPDIRLLEWRQLRWAAIKIPNSRQEHSRAHKYINISPPCSVHVREILQSSDPGASFRKARHKEVWAVEKEGGGTKTAVVLTGPELVNTGINQIKV